MKPFFTNPFKPLITRTGQAIGKAAERGMLQAVDGPGTIRKRFQTNPDGSTTMLHTQNGLTRFSTTGKKNEFTITSAEFFVRSTTSARFFAMSTISAEFVVVPTYCYATHTFHHTPRTWSGPFRMWIVNKLGLPNLRITGLSDGFTISGDIVSTPPGFPWYPAFVYVRSDEWVHAHDHIGEIAYEIHIGPSRRNNPDVFGVGTLTGI